MLTSAAAPGTEPQVQAQYIPVNFTQTATLTQDIVFNGIRYRLGLPVNSTSTGRRTSSPTSTISSRRTAGSAASSSRRNTPTSGAAHQPDCREFIHAQAPIPAIGGIARVYVVPNISITGELTGVKIPDSISKEYKAHYADLDIYGTLNFTNNIGVQGGYRSVDVGYLDSDTGVVCVEGDLLRGGGSVLSRSLTAKTRRDSNGHQEIICSSLCTFVTFCGSASSARERRRRDELERAADRLRSASRPSCRNRIAASVRPAAASR